MLGLLVALLLGIAIGLGRGGSFAQLERVRLKALPFLFGAVGVQVLATILNRPLDGWISFGLVLLSFASVFGFAFANRSHVGMPLVAAGSLSNFLVVLVNRGMPVSLNALRSAGLGNPFLHPAREIPKGAHRLMTDATRLRFLGDIIPLRVGGSVVSVGDLLIWAGLILLLQHLMVGSRGKHHTNV